MAASFSLTFNCRNCGRGTITLTNASESAGGYADATKKRKAARCTICGQPLMGEAASLVLVHSGNVGSNTTITHTVANGAITSAAS